MRCSEEEDIDWLWIGRWLQAEARLNSFLSYVLEHTV
jgi:hypothetical protein